MCKLKPKRGFGRRGIVRLDWGERETSSYIFHINDARIIVRELDRLTIEDDMSELSRVQIVEFCNVSCRATRRYIRKNLPLWINTSEIYWEEQNTLDVAAAYNRIVSAKP